MPGCRIDQASPQFNKLREHWKNNGYPKIDADLEEAFKAVSKDVQANHCRRVPRFSAVLGNFILYKYRQKDKAAREGARSGWRFYALLNKNTSVLYPIIVYPKKAWQDAGEDMVNKAIEEILAILSKPASLF